MQWIEEELQTAVGDPGARIPVDKEGARVLFTVNPREPKFFPLTLQASATVFHAAKEDWTVASEGWDLTNYGLFTGDSAQAGAIADNLLRSMERLGCRVLVIGECGHGYRRRALGGAGVAAAASTASRSRSFLEVMEDYFQEGRLAGRSGPAPGPGDAARSLQSGPARRRLGAPARHPAPDGAPSSWR